MKPSYLAHVTTKPLVLGLACVLQTSLIETALANETLFIVLRSVSAIADPSINTAPRSPIGRGDQFVEYTGDITYYMDVDTSIQIAADGIIAGWDYDSLESFSATLSFVEGKLVSGQANLEVNTDGLNRFGGDTTAYSTSLSPRPDDSSGPFGLLFNLTLYDIMCVGETFGGQFSDSQLNGVDISRWVNEPPLTSYMGTAFFEPNAQGYDEDVHVDFMIIVPTPATMSMFLISGPLLVSGRHRKLA